MWRLSRSDNVHEMEDCVADARRISLQLEADYMYEYTYTHT